MNDLELSKKIYEILKTVLTKEISRREGIDKLISEGGMSKGYAEILIGIFHKLYKGEEFKRTLGAQLLDDLLNNLLNDYKIERLKIALLGLRKHLDYRKLKDGSKLNVIYDKYFHIVETGNITDGFHEYMKEANDDELQKIQVWINQRKNQSKFKLNLLKKYNSQCLISKIKVPELIEAAHIFPHSKSGQNNIANGILLRTDLHILFDRGLLCIDPENFNVIIDKSLEKTEYQKFHDLKVDLIEESKEFLLLKNSYYSNGKK
ncbi:HNH endonuclease signature motif containing protein [Flavobacterium dauae]|uniref:HNH endonuclease n=1 Tax=Flavobacterium dauae TaxID=1563479 RepID=UPI00101B2FE4|nr:HNH endonuclease signature motif containing protein [Flavobacterium dauae]WLD23470.1 HNH endonuclease signature motif containing protein [Flavobacterium dauae]